MIDSWFTVKWKNKTEAKMSHLYKKYHLKKVGFKYAIETIKQRVLAKTKYPSKGNEVGNFRPIACLNIMWKIMSGIFAEKPYGNLDTSNLLPFEQKG